MPFFYSDDSDGQFNSYSNNFFDTQLKDEKKYANSENKTGEHVYQNFPSH